MSKTGEGRPAPAHQPRDTPNTENRKYQLIEDAWRVHGLIQALGFVLEYAGDNPDRRLKAINAAEAVVLALEPRARTLPDAIETAFLGRA